MATTAAVGSVPVSFSLSSRSVTRAESARPLFIALAPLHRLSDREAVLLERAAAGKRFIAVTHPFGMSERELMRLALVDLDQEAACVVEAAAMYAADVTFEDGHLVWERISAEGRRCVMWLVAILRVAEGLDRVCCASSGSVHAAWSIDLLHLEIDGVALSRYDVDQVMSRVAALEAIAEKRVVFTSAVQRRGAA